MAEKRTFTIELDGDLAARLSVAARVAGVTPQHMAAECVAQRLEIALRHLVLVQRFEAIDEHLTTLAQFVSTAAQGHGEAADLSWICRYRRERQGE